MKSHPLKIWREQNGLTQAQLGQQLGVSDMAVSRWERGRFPETVQMRQIIAFTLGAVTPNDWFEIPGVTASKQETLQNGTPPESTRRKEKGRQAGQKEGRKQRRDAR